MKRLAWITMCLFFACGVFAQTTEDPYAEQKAEIRNLKLSDEYFYSDVSSADLEETRAMARQLLVLAIQQEEPEAMGVDTLVADSCRYIDLQRVDRPRVFAYLSKEAVAVWLYHKHHPGQALPVVAAAMPEAVQADTLPATQSDSTKSAAPQTTLLPADTVKVAEAPLQVQDSVLAEDLQAFVVPVDTVRQVVVDTVRTVLHDTLRVTVTDTVHVTLRDTSRVTVVDTIRASYKPKATGNARLDKIVAMKTIQEVQDYFIAEKRAGRMMFGKMDSAVNPESSYVLIFARDGSVVAVLDKGDDARLNFTTGKSGDRIANYKGYGIIWFLLY